MPSFNFVAIIAATASFTFAQSPVTTFATGLSNPSKIISIQNSRLLVTETNNTPNSGRVSILDPSGVRITLIDGLPSGLAVPSNDPDGPNGLILAGRTLYVANGEGDSHVNGPRPGSVLPNPAGPLSPIFSSIIQASFSNDVDKLTSGFSLKLQDHFTLLDGASITLTNATGDTATVQLFTAFRLDIPDPNTIYRNSHPYGLTALPSSQWFSTPIYAVDAGMNTLLQIDPTSGKSKVLVRFSPTPNPTGAPPVSEAVPTSVQVYEQHLLVTLLSGAPFNVGASRVMEVDPATGKATLFIASLTSAIDTLYRKKADGTPQFFVLQYSSALAAQPTPPGNLLLYTSPSGQTFASGLKTPTSMTLDPLTGKIFITDRSGGNIVSVDAGN